MKLIPKKSLGQHFLNSRHVLDQIISAANIRKGEKVLEIGPGTGILTAALLEAGAEVIAVEKDYRSIDILKTRFTTEIADSRLDIIHGDILDPALIKNVADKHGSAGSRSKANRSLPSSSYCIVANIPYYITGAILEKFLENDPRPERMVLLVQKEVADRIVAHDDKESVLSISVKAFGTPKLIAKVPRGAFTPPPNVDSAILAIENISTTKFGSGSPDTERFFRVVKSGFAHKRKYLIRNLESVSSADILAQVWQKTGLDQKIRPEDLAIEKWLEISDLLLK